MVKVKRAYEAPARADGHRVLVERLWPRGVRKQALAIDAWPKELAPSTALRKWFGHDPERWREFRRRYRAELAHAPQSELLRALAEQAAAGPLTLIFAAHDVEHNSAVVLRDQIERRVTRRRRSGGGRRAAPAPTSGRARSRRASRRDR